MVEASHYIWNKEVRWMKGGFLKAPVNICALVSVWVACRSRSEQCRQLWAAPAAAQPGEEWGGAVIQWILQTVFENSFHKL